MNLEQTEAFCLDIAKHRRLFAALGSGDYLLTEDELLALIQVAHKAGAVEGGKAVGRIVDSMCTSIRIAE